MAQRCSIVVVSRERPAMLMRCLDGVAQLDHPTFEVIVVACPAGVAAVSARPDAKAIKLIPYDTANISAARNLGIAAAAGDVIAFIDDDAVPEPLWLRNLAAPLAEDADCAGGFVIGRNGISLQWGARQVDCLGEAHPLVQDAAPDADKALKTEGTNMAVRRAALVSLGGFDSRFHFYLDETDLNWRLHQAGLRAVLVPDAVVHHGFAASARRKGDRTPTDLSEIGASTALYLQKHAPKAACKPALRAARKAQRQRLLRLMQRGPLGADDVRRLLRGFDKGAKQGLARPEPAAPPLAEPTEPFLQYPSTPDAPRIALSAWSFRKTSARKKAIELRQNGAIVSLYLLSPSSLFHHVHFTQEGLWVQSGGLFGRSERNARPLQIWRFQSRVAAETKRTLKARGGSP